VSDNRTKGNGKPSVSISTLVVTKYQGGDAYTTISQLLSKNPTGTMVLHINQGGISGMEWQEKKPHEESP
jgi:hypothetical protein